MKKKKVSTDWSQAKLIILGILGVVAVVALALLVAGGGEGGVSDAVEHGEELQVPDSWRTFSSNDLNFSIKHPREVRAEDKSGGRVQFSLFGPGNEAGSQITDGFSLTVSRESYAGAPSLQAYVESEYTQALQVSEGVLDPTPTTFQDRQAYAYVVRAENEVEHIYVWHSKNTALHLSWNVADPSGRGYAAVIDTMLATLSFTGGGVGAPVFTHINLAILNTTPAGDPERGCDEVVFVKQETLSPTTQPLNAALTLLFSLEEETISGYFNFIARTNNTLSFQRATIEDGVANIFLTGELTGLAGVCDDPRAKIQIEETALNFDTVEAVRLFLNGEETDLQPSRK